MLVVVCLLFVRLCVNVFYACHFLLSMYVRVFVGMCRDTTLHFLLPIPYHYYYWKGLIFCVIYAQNMQTKFWRVNNFCMQ